MDYHFLIKLRKESNFTKSFVAEKINVTRPTYDKIESGQRELTVNEAKQLANLYNIDLYSFLNSEKVMYKVDIQKKSNKQEKKEIRINVPEKNIEKFKEVLIYILSQIGSKPNFGEVVLYKLLYFIDFDYYEQYEEQLIGATYIKNHFGPTPVEFKKVIDQMIKKGDIIKIKDKYFNYPQTKYLPTREADLSKIKNARELNHINDVLNRLSNKNAKELSEYSHKDVP